MKRRVNWLVVLVVFLAVTLVVVSFGYSRYYLPSMKAYSTYLEIYQEYGSDEIKSINISSINHQLIVKKSNTDKIKIDYYQKADNSNTYSVTNGVLSLNIIENVEDINNLLFKAEKKINIITVYLPESTSINMTYSSITGPSKISDIIINNLNISNVTGEIKLDNIDVNGLTVSTNGGNVEVTDSIANIFEVSNVSGKVHFKIKDSLDDYGCAIRSDYGSIVLNGEEVKETDEDGVEKIARSYNTDVKMKKRFAVVTVRSSIIIDYPVEVEEPQPVQEGQ